ncbi:MAG: EthD domain-containing protein [Dehalococcoidia bacterium]|nr:EthD domain-containing protein [Dehalococcoidia bacterium]
MLKVVRMVKRRKDLTLPRFKAYWLEHHVPLEQRVVQTTPVRKIVASFSTGQLVGGTEPPFDGMASIYFDSLADLKATFAGPTPAMMRKDEENFIDLTGEVVRTITEEYNVAEHASAPAVLKTSGQLKIIRTVRRRPDLTLEQFKARWMSGHVPLEKKVIEMAPVRRIIASFALPETAGGLQPAFDGMAELYFESLDDIRALFASPVPAMMRKDEEDFIDLTGEVVRSVSEEYVVAERA